MRIVPKPNPPITAEGLKSYLDRTIERHDGNDYEEFVKRINYGEPKTVIARAFQVSTKTIRRWLEIYNKGASNEK